MGRGWGGGGGDNERRAGRCGQGGAAARPPANAAPPPPPKPPLFCAGQSDISWADLEVLAARAALLKSFLSSKMAAAAAKGNAGDVGVARSITAPFPVTLGRVDAAGPAASRLPAAGASVEDIKAFLTSLGTQKAGGKPLFWERPGFLLWTAAAGDGAAEEARLAAGDPGYAAAKEMYDRSRRTVSRTGENGVWWVGLRGGGGGGGGETGRGGLGEGGVRRRRPPSVSRPTQPCIPSLCPAHPDYEVDVVDAFTRAASSRCGATVDADAYLYPLTIPTVRGS